MKKFFDPKTRKRRKNYSGKAILPQELIPGYQFTEKDKTALKKD